MRALVLGAGGFIGSHMVRRLRQEGYWVRAVDLKYPDFSETQAHEFFAGDLTEPAVMARALEGGFDEVYQFAADMGGAGYIFTGEHDADVMTNSGLINLNLLKACRHDKPPKIFYSSSACMYPEHNQLDPNNPNCAEDSAYPAAPDSEYGWEKLFSERLYLAYARNYGFEVRIARYHNIFGPEGTWRGGKEKAPAAICRKVLESDAEIEIWGDGEQTRSFLYIDECIEGTRRLMQSNWTGPVNIGSDQMISINNLARMAMSIEGRIRPLRHVPGPLGVRGRVSDNRLIRERLGWAPSMPLVDGITATYHWIKGQIEKP